MRKLVLGASHVNPKGSRYDNLKIACCLEWNSKQLSHYLFFLLYLIFFLQNLRNLKFSIRLWHLKIPYILINCYLTDQIVVNHQDDHFASITLNKISITLTVI